MSMLETTPTTTSEKEEQNELIIHYQRLIEPISIILLTVMAMLGPVVVIRDLMPDVPWIHLPILVIISAIAGVFTTNWLHHPDRLILNRSMYRLAEISLLLVVARLVSWAIYEPLTAELFRSYLLSPLSIFDARYLIVGILILLSWYLARSFAVSFVGLALGVSERTYLASDNSGRNEIGVEGMSLKLLADRPALLASFFSVWINVGLILLLCAGATSLDLRQVGESGVDAFRTIGRLGLQPILLFAMLIYFFLGLVLLSRGRLQIMRIRWMLDRVEPDPAVIKQWQRASVALLLVVGLIAAFLPIGSTVPIAIFITYLIRLFIAIVGIVTGVLFFIAALFLSIFRTGDSGEAVEELVAPEPPPPPEIVPAEASEPMSEGARLLLGTGFWIVIVALVLVAILFYLRERGFQINSQLLRRIWKDLKQLWHHLWHGVDRRVKAVRAAVAARIRRDNDEDGKPSPWGFIRVNGLPPREQIRFFYLSTLRRAEERGVPRHEHETPLEFAESLKESWPEAEEDVELLTAAFLEARYSAREIKDDESTPIKRRWRSVKRRLRRRRQVDTSAADADDS